MGRGACAQEEEKGQERRRGLGMHRIHWRWRYRRPLARRPVVRAFWYSEEHRADRLMSSSSRA